MDNDNQYTSETEITLNALYRSDSVINTMEVFDSKLFMGLQNGELLSFNGSTITVEHNDYLNSRSINFIKTDDNLLYIFFKNTTEILIMNKNSRGDYIFTTVDTGN